jgi:hypothetical protein
VVELAAGRELLVPLEAGRPLALPLGGTVVGLGVVVEDPDVGGTLLGADAEDGGAVPVAVGVPDPEADTEGMSDSC